MALMKNSEGLAFWAYLARMYMSSELMVDLLFNNGFMDGCDTVRSRDSQVNLLRLLQIQAPGHREV